MSVYTSRKLSCAVSVTVEEETFPETSCPLSPQIRSLVKLLDEFRIWKTSSRSTSLEKSSYLRQIVSKSQDSDEETTRGAQYVDKKKPVDLQRIGVREFTEAGKERTISRGILKNSTCVSKAIPLSNTSPTWANRSGKVAMDILVGRSISSSRKYDCECKVWKSASLSISTQRVTLVRERTWRRMVKDIVSIEL